MTRPQRNRADGKGSYPADWYEIATAIKDAAEWRCERCRHPHDTPTYRAECDELCDHALYPNQAVLTVHHLDMNPANCEPWNLVALCQACHLSVQGRFDFTQSWMFDLPDWVRRKWDQFAETVQ